MGGGGSGGTAGRGHVLRKERKGALRAQYYRFIERGEAVGQRHRSHGADVSGNRTGQEARKRKKAFWRASPQPSYSSIRPVSLSFTHSSPGLSVI